MTMMMTIAKLKRQLKDAEDTRNRAQAAAQHDLERRRDVEARLVHYVQRYKPVEEALEHARQKHPSPRYRMHALVEELGEMAQAWIDHGQHSQECKEEAYQLIATVLRVVEEKDETGP